MSGRRVVLTGDLGPSFKYRDYTVNDIIAQSLPISVALGERRALLRPSGLGLSAGILSAPCTAVRRLDLVLLRLAATSGASRSRTSSSPAFS